MLGTGAILIMLLAAPSAGAPEDAPIVPPPVLAGDPILEEPSDEAKPDPKLLHLQPATRRLFDAIKDTRGSDTIDSLLAAAIDELGMDCPQLRDYQIYRLAKRSRTLKVKCAERPLYAITVGPTGDAYVSGGDGSIEPMRLQEGPIRTVLGIPAEQYMARRRGSAESLASVNDLLTREAQPEPPPPLDWRPFFGAIGILAALALAWVLLSWRNATRRSFARWQDLDTETKDRIVAESEEIFPNLYRHPEGVFIARGRRGKRRLFPSLMFAYLYTSSGVKLFEIR
jgi:hypothetical protein